MGMPRRLSLPTALLQPFALAGLIYWSVWFSLLASPAPFPAWEAVLGTQLFFLSSSVWPFATHSLLVSSTRPLRLRLGACLPLWVAGSGVVYLLVRTCQTWDGSPLSSLAIASLSVASLVAAGLDGGVWCGYCLLTE